MENLNHLPFGMILNLDIGLRHLSRLLDMKYLRKNEKGQKNFFEGHIKDQIRKNDFLKIF